MSWKTLQVDGLVSVEQEIATFSVSLKHPDLPMSFRIRIVERKDGSFIGHPEIALKGADGQPDWTSGRGATVEDALADTIKYFLQTIGGKEPLGDDSIWWDPRF